MFYFHFQIFKGLNMNKLILLSLFVAFTLIVACQDEEEQQIDMELIQAINLNANGTDYYIFPNSDQYSKIPQDPKNRITKEKVALGQLLYHETGIATNPRMPASILTYSCASCHFAGAGFQANMIQGIAEGGKGFGINGENRSKKENYQDEDLDVQPVRTPSTLNIAYQKNVLWNGQFGATGKNTGTEQHWTADTPKETNHLGFEGTETQAIAGLGVHRMKVENNSIILNTEYKAMFDAAFPTVPVAERYTQKYAGLAIAAFERVLLANRAPFQDWLKGDSKAMTKRQKKGALLFFGKANCIDCHNSPALNDMDFHALGMKDLSDCVDLPVFNAPPNNSANLGRGDFTGLTEDNYKFKTPQLYNLKDSKFYGHGGSFRSVEDVIRYKNKAVPEANIDASALSPDFKPLGLTDEEIMQLVDFIENSLYDAELKRYEPSSLPSGLCFPNNDPTSRADLGCG